MGVILTISIWCTWFRRRRCLRSGRRAARRTCQHRILQITWRGASSVVTQPAESTAATATRHTATSANFFRFMCMFLCFWFNSLLRLSGSWELIYIRLSKGAYNYAVGIAVVFQLIYQHLHLIYQLVMYWRICAIICLFLNCLMRIVWFVDCPLMAVFLFSGFILWCASGNPRRFCWLFFWDVLGFFQILFAVP